MRKPICLGGLQDTVTHVHTVLTRTDAVRFTKNSLFTLHALRVLNVFEKRSRGRRKQELTEWPPRPLSTHPTMALLTPSSVPRERAPPVPVAGRTLPTRLPCTCRYTRVARFASGARCRRHGWAGATRVQNTCRSPAMPSGAVISPRKSTAGTHDTSSSELPGLDLVAEPSNEQPAHSDSHSFCPCHRAPAPEQAQEDWSYYLRTWGIFEHGSEDGSEDGPARGPTRGPENLGTASAERQKKTQEFVHILA